MSASPTTPHATTTAPPPAIPLARSDARDTATWDVLRWLMPFALLHGLLYLVLIPPWQHYDEPTNFEYARLIAEDGQLSSVGAVNRATRWEISNSMERGNFWRGKPTPMVAWDVPFIGYDQRVHPPLYYLVATLPIRATLGLPVEVQLYAARLIGVLLYVCSVAAVWRLGVVLAPDRPVVQLALPMTYATTASFASLMTAVNSDVLINFTGAALLLGCALLIRDGLRPIPLILAVVSLVVGVMAKRTALMDVVPLALALVWSVARRPVRFGPWLWLTLPIMLAGSLLTLQIDSSGPYPTLGLRPWVNLLDSAYLRLDLDRLVHSLSDWRNSLPVYREFFTVAFVTHWGTYGWGDVHLGPLWVWTMLILSAASLVGLARWALQGGQGATLWQRRCYGMFAALAAVGCVAMLFRLHPLPPYGDYFYLPRGRYLYGMLAATIALLLLGLSALLPEQRRDQGMLALCGLFVLVDTLGMAGILIMHYYGLPWPLEVVSRGKPGLLGLPPLYVVLGGLYLGSLFIALRRIGATLRLA